MKHDVQLRSFITFILLAAIPKNRSVAVSDLTHIKLATPRIPPVAQFLKIALDLIREREAFAIDRASFAQLVFRFDTVRH